MHTVHAGFSIIVPLHQGKEETVEVLRQMNTCPGNNSLIPFSQSLTTLFVSASVLPAQHYHNKPLPPALMFLTSFCGPLDNHLDELIRIGHNGLCALFQHCNDFPPNAHQNSNALKAFLKKYRTKDLFYSGMHHITPTDVAREEELRKAIKRFVDDNQKARAFDGLDVVAIRKKIQYHIESTPGFEWAKPYKETPLDFWKRSGSGMIAILMALTLLLSGIWLLFPLFSKHGVPTLFYSLVVVLAVPVLFLDIVSIVIESGEQAVAKRSPDERMRLLAATQYRAVLNELTTVGLVKKGWWRRAVFRSIPYVVGWFSGWLTIPTIATARWIAADGGRRLVFISNYANTASSYVRDFIDSKRSASFINLLFGHGEGFPKTLLLFWCGTRSDPEGFMNVFYKTQRVTQFWFGAFENLSVDNINNNRAIRNGLFAPLTLDEIEQWLRRL